MRNWHYINRKGYPRRGREEGSALLPISIIVAALIIIGGFVAYTEYNKKRVRTAVGEAGEEPAADEGYQLVTLDGYEPGTGRVLNEITLWEDADNRAPTDVYAKAKHGDKAYLLIQKGENCLVETWDGKQGWVEYYHIKELREPAQSP